VDALAPLAAEAVTLLPYIVLVSIRVGVALASLPAPLGSGAPTVVRAAIGFVLAAAMALATPGPAAHVVLDPFYLGVAALGEAVVGAAIGLSGRAVVAAAEVAGELAGGAMGLGFARVIDPNSGEDLLVIARLAGLGAMALFLLFDGHHILLAGLARSLEVAPVGDAFSALSPDVVVSSLGAVFGAGLRIASPVVGVLFFVQLALGLVARAAPRLQVFGLSFAIAVLVGLMVLHAALPSALLGIEQDLAALPGTIDTLLAAR
jgi:flagellar biosynthetic protein FliR